MLKNIENILSNKLFFILSILVLIFITRVGFWNLIIIDGSDEITYLLSGREILNNKLPYRDFWEIKPPIAFLPYILANLFSNEIFAIRVIGFFTLVLTSCLLFFQISKITNIFLGKIFTIIFILLNTNSFFQSSGLTLFIYPLLISISYFLIEKKKSNNNYFLIGLLVSFICLIRPNFYPLVIGILLINYLINKNNLKNIFLYIFGGVTPLIVIIIFYSTFDNGLNILKNFLFNLLAAGSYNNFFWNLREVSRYLLDGVDGIIFLTTILLILFNFKNFVKEKINVIFLILFISCFISVLIVFTGNYQFNNFYLYLIILASLTLKNINIQNKIKFKILILTISSIIPFLLSSSISIVKNNNIFFESNNKLLSYDKTKLDKNEMIINYLKKIINKSDKIYAYDNFFYLKLKKELMSNIIHPTNFYRLHIYKNIPGVEKNTELEYLKILEKRPDWLIIRKEIFDNEKYFSKNFKEIVMTKWNLYDILKGNDDHYLFKISNN